MTKLELLNEHLNKERYRLSYNGWFYAIQRMDLLIVTISGAGIYVGLEVLKFSTDYNLPLLWLVKSSGITMVTSIISNLASQWTGKETNKYDMLMRESELLADKPISEEDKSEIEQYDDLSNKYSFYTRRLNILSLILMGGRF